MIHILKFAGWTFGRWAYAAAWHKRVYGTLPDPDVDTALALQRKWQQAHPGHDPWARPTSADHDFAWATTMMECARRYSEQYVFRAKIGQEKGLDDSQSPSP